jgi:hypothetical protein
VAAKLRRSGCRSGSGDKCRSIAAESDFERCLPTTDPGTGAAWAVLAEPEASVLGSLLRAGFLQNVDRLLFLSVFRHLPLSANGPAEMGT